MNKFNTISELKKNIKACALFEANLPCPSPRNNIWLKKNPWFEKKLVPKLAKKVKGLFA